MLPHEKLVQEILPTSVFLISAWHWLFIVKLPLFWGEGDRKVRWNWYVNFGRKEETI